MLVPGMECESRPIPGMDHKTHKSGPAVVPLKRDSSYLPPRVIPKKKLNKRTYTQPPKEGSSGTSWLSQNAVGLPSPLQK